MEALTGEASVRRLGGWQYAPFTGCGNLGQLPATLRTTPLGSRSGYSSD